MERNNKGQFVYTTGAGRYKRVIRDGKNLQLHRVIWEEHYGKIPDGMVIHHKDFNKMNNDITNLQAMTFDEHNNIHKHPAWNKGLQGDKRSIDMAIKAWKTKYKTLFPKYKEAFMLKKKGLKLVEISKIQGITATQVRGRLKRYEELIAV